MDIFTFAVKFFPWALVVMCLLVFCLYWSNYRAGKKAQAAAKAAGEDAEQEQAPVNKHGRDVNFPYMARSMGLGLVLGLILYFGKFLTLPMSLGFGLLLGLICGTLRRR